MLTERQLARLRASSRCTRVATAMSLADVTQVTVAEAIGVTQAYVSDVALRMAWFHDAQRTTRPGSARVWQGNPVWRVVTLGCSFVLLRC